jgi:hypothetical protein
MGRRSPSTSMHSFLYDGGTSDITWQVSPNISHLWSDCDSHWTLHIWLDGGKGLPQCYPHRCDWLRGIWRYVHVCKHHLNQSAVCSNSLVFKIPTQVYMTIAYNKYAASAIAASSVLRSLAGALVPLTGIPRFDRLGLGWGASLLAFISLGLGGLPVLFCRYGEAWRKKPVELD